MGLKSFFLLIILVFLAVFSIQNLQSISLVFFGFNSLTLPLSFWIVFSLLAGIISSLLVQFLSRSPRQKINYNQSFPTPPPQPNYPPSPTVPERLTPPTNSQRIPTPQVRDERYSGDDFDIFEEATTFQADDRHRGYNNQKPIEEQPVTNFSADEQDRSSTVDKTFVPENQPNKVEAQTSSEENSVDQSKKSPVAEAPAEALLKAREASLYSYQPREKTEIKIPKRAEKTEANNRSNNSTYSRRIDGIYDAPYRVIPPSREPLSEDNDDIYYDDEDDDWDF